MSVNIEEERTLPTLPTLDGSIRRCHPVKRCPLTGECCLREQCAWWNAHACPGGACAVVLLPTHADVRALENRLSDLAATREAE